MKKFKLIAIILMAGLAFALSAGLNGLSGATVFAKPAPTNEIDTLHINVDVPNVGEAFSAPAVADGWTDDYEIDTSTGYKWQDSATLYPSSAMSDTTVLPNKTYYLWVRADIIKNDYGFKDTLEIYVNGNKLTETRDYIVGTATSGLASSYDLLIKLDSIKTPQAQTPWWVWALIGVGAVAIIATTITLIAKKRKTKAA
jgi:hypothetical protein